MGQTQKSTSLLYYHTSFFWTQNNITQPDPPLNLSDFTEAVSKSTIYCLTGQLKFFYSFIYSVNSRGRVPPVSKCVVVTQWGPLLGARGLGGRRQEQ